ncbi:unnamed protein product [Protopolystoma xenopodis]|uniref:Uncharacterized protein n=1 Tax=Protopolystoma xenopodis TaxID=117903 RepID=A0A3S5B053_9PLAT|nr:unnamed protein product [Protopolystoma xenopodis]
MVSYVLFFQPVAFQGHINKTAAAAYLASMNGNPGGALTTATAAAVHSSASNAISCPVCSSLGSSSTIHMTISNCGSSVPLVSLSGKDEAGTRSSSSSSSTSAQLSSGLKAVSNIFPTSKASLSSLATTASAGGTTGCNSSPVAVISTAMSNCELNGPIIADLSCSQASLSSTGLPGSSICQTSGLGSTASTGPINRSDIVASTASVSAIASPPDGFGPDGIVVRPASGSDATTNSCNTSGNTGSGQSVLNCRKTSLVETNGSSVSRDLELNYLTS